MFLPAELQLSEAQALVGLQVLGMQHLIQPRAIEQSSKLPHAVGMLRRSCGNSSAPCPSLPALLVEPLPCAPSVPSLAAVAARSAIARALARQWFGVLLRAASPLDEWLVEGEQPLLCPATLPAAVLSAGAGRQQTGSRGPACNAPPAPTGLSGWLEEQVVRKYMGKNELAYRWGQHYRWHYCRRHPRSCCECHPLLTETGTCVRDAGAGAIASLCSWQTTARRPR